MQKEETHCPGQARKGLAPSESSGRSSLDSYKHTLNTIYDEFQMVLVEGVNVAAVVIASILEIEAHPAVIVISKVF